VVVALAAPASAHVTLHSNDAVQGGSDALVSIRVPNEEDQATTTQVEVDFPSDAPLLNLLVEPTPGWTFKVTNTTLPKPITTDDGTFTQVVTQIIWSGGNIPVGGYQDFNIDVSTLPTVPTLQVKALQTYSNGDIVRWIDPPAAAGQPAPDHPAPTLDLAPAPPDNSSATPTTVTAGSSAAAPSGSSGGSQVASPSLKGLAKTSDVNGAKTISIIALVIGIIGLLGAAGAFLAGRRTA